MPNREIIRKEVTDLLSEFDKSNTDHQKIMIQITVELLKTGDINYRKEMSQIILDNCLVGIRQGIVNEPTRFFELGAVCARVIGIEAVKEFETAIQGWHIHIPARIHELLRPHKTRAPNHHITNKDVMRR